MIDVKVGETVIVCEQYRKPREATVVNVARIWITVVDGSEREYRFRRDDQTDGPNANFPNRFYTLDQWAENRRSGEALNFLRDQGIDLRYDSPWKGRESGLADVLRNAGRG